MNPVENRMNADFISGSSYFDEKWYLNEYPDVALGSLSPAEHYIAIGAEIGRNPSQSFSTMDYREANPDVAASDVNPLIHYLKFGISESRPTKKITAPKIISDSTLETIDVVVPVYNAYEDVQRCLEAVKVRSDGFRMHIFVVNDGSEPPTTEWLRKFTLENSDNFTLIEHEKNKGYTTAVNTGLKATKGDYVVTLNSDTIVSRGWAASLVRCMKSSPKIGITGPLSNAASWQNVPSLYDENGQFAVNEIPQDLSCDEFAEIIRNSSKRTYPRTPFLNGFCFMIKREVIDAVGYMDEDAFPIGYGEENDFCIRAADAGYELAIADDGYVFHAKSKSFGHSKRKELSKAGSDQLKKKHGAERFAKLVDLVKDTKPMDSIRESIQFGLKAQERQESWPQISELKILFLLPVKGGGGGAHSVVQEVNGMRRLGIEAHVGVRQEHLELLQNSYADIPDIKNIFIGIDLQNIHLNVSRYDIVVATIYSSITALRRICDANPHILPAYYVQDYESMFFEPGSEQWVIAKNSYELVPEATYFAKTDWIARAVKENHGIHVNRVQASIDHEVYRPGRKNSIGAIEVTAMIRPATPRRGAERTMLALRKIKEKWGASVLVNIFGCDDKSPEYALLQTDFNFENYGILKRPEVSALLGRSDIFIDMSDYQAFGRTGLEAMACACTSIVPIQGGGDEYILDGVNGYAVDSFNIDEVVNRVDAMIEQPTKLREMQYEALKTASRYSVHRACVSEAVLLAEALAKKKKVQPKAVKRKAVALLPKRDDGEYSSIAWERCLKPFASPKVYANIDVKYVESLDVAIEPQEDSILYIVEGDRHDQELLAKLVDKWQRKNNKIVIDCDLSKPFCDLQKSEQLARMAATVIVARQPDLSEPNASAKVQFIPSAICSSTWKVNENRNRSKGHFPRPVDKLLIGYLGHPSFPNALKSLQSVLQEIEKYPTVEIEIIGTFQAVKSSIGNRVGLPKRNSYNDYVAWLLARVNWHIFFMTEEDLDRDYDSLRRHVMEIGALGGLLVCPKGLGQVLNFVNEDNCLFYSGETEFKEQIDKVVKSKVDIGRFESELRRTIIDIIKSDAVSDAIISVIQDGSA